MNTNIPRRQALQFAGSLAALTGLAMKLPPSHLSGVAPSKTDPNLHLLRRTTFGPSRSDRNHLNELGRLAWLDEQLAAPSADPSEVEQLLSTLDTLSMKPAQLLDLQDNPRVSRQRIAATLIRHLLNPNQLFEVMVDFWSDHFSTFLRDGPVLYLKGIDDRQVIREHALGSFPAMLRASAHSPAMLVYLDNARSQAPDPNENYARELLELHTLGISGGYGQQDIERAALAFTGWTVTPLRGGRLDPGDFLYVHAWHQDAKGTFLGEPLLRSGYDQGLEIIDRLARHPSTARHISQKLCLRFVSDQPPAILVEHIADTYLNSEGDIATMLRELFSSKEFESSAGQKMKRGLDFVLSSLRVLGSPRAPERLVASGLQAMGHVPFSWPAPDGFPHENSPWADSNQLLSRWSFVMQLLQSPISQSLEYQIQSAMSPAKFLDFASDYLLGENLQIDARAILENLILEAGKSIDKAALVALVMASPQFQRR